MLKQVQTFLGARESRFTRWDATDDSSRTSTAPDSGKRLTKGRNTLLRSRYSSAKSAPVLTLEPWRVLIEHGALKPESDKCATRKERLPDDRHTRVYRITPKLWEVEA